MEHDFVERSCRRKRKAGEHRRVAVGVSQESFVVEAKHSARTRGMAFDWTMQATQPAIIRARDYWQSRRGERAMPTRSDLDPVAMRGFTEHIGLVEVRRDTGAEVDYFIRRAGTKWEAVFGPMTGRLIQEFLPPQIESRWRQAFDAVCQAKAPLRLTTDILFQNKSWLEAELFIGPLGDGEVAMLLIGFASWNRDLNV